MILIRLLGKDAGSCSVMRTVAIGVAAMDRALKAMFSPSNTPVFMLEDDADGNGGALSVRSWRLCILLSAS